MTRVAITTGDTAGGTRRASSSYGPRKIANGLPTTYVNDKSQVLEIPFTYDALPTYGLDKIIQSIPAKAHVDEVDLLVTTAFAGGTSLAVGAYKADGTAIDADGFVTDAGAPLANLTPSGAVLHGGGALVGTSLAYDSQVKVTATGTFTAGAGVIVVKFTPYQTGIDNYNS